VEMAADRTSSPGRQKWRIVEAPFLPGILLRNCEANHRAL